MDIETLFCRRGNGDSQIPFEIEKIRAWLSTIPGNLDLMYMKTGQPLTPLMIVARSARPNSIEIVQLLIAYGATVDYMGPHNNMTPALGQAIFQMISNPVHKYNMIKVLLENKANPNIIPTGSNAYLLATLTLYNLHDCVLLMRTYNANPLLPFGNKPTLISYCESQSDAKQPAKQKMIEILKMGATYPAHEAMIVERERLAKLEQERLQQQKQQQEQQQRDMQQQLRMQQIRMQQQEIDRIERERIDKENLLTKQKLEEEMRLEKLRLEEVRKQQMLEAQAKLETMRLQEEQRRIEMEKQLVEAKEQLQLLTQTQTADNILLQENAELKKIIDELTNRIMQLQYVVQFLYNKTETQ